ncbi:MAG: cytochrome c1 [Rhodospirillales bacterium]|nr:cytochrome c1 [Rhodospirillales bacterium]
MNIKAMITGLGTVLLLASYCTTVQAAGGATPPPKLDWSFQGPFGGFDRPQLKRGWQVYNEVCSGCHSIKQIYYRHLEQIGYSADEVKKFAANAEVPAGPNEDGETHEDGELIVRPGKPFDQIKMPFPNDAAARTANNGALPPDLSLTTKAHPKGVDYIPAVLTGYNEPPAGYKMNEGMYYNTFYAGKQIAMPNPLSDDAVEYVDGTKATAQQMAIDVSAFLAWAAEPEMEDRKRLGIKIILFLIVLTSLLYALKRRIWSDVH